MKYKLAISSLLRVWREVTMWRRSWYDVGDDDELASLPDRELPWKISQKPRVTRHLREVSHLQLLQNIDVVVQTLEKQQKHEMFHWYFTHYVRQ